MLYQYLVLPHSADTCSSSSSCSDAMRMRVSAVFAAPPSLQDLSLNKTLLFPFSLILPLPAFSRVSDPLQSPGPACGTRWYSHSPPANCTQACGSRAPHPPLPGRPPPLQSPGTSCGTRWPLQSPPVSDMRRRGRVRLDLSRLSPTSFQIARRCVWCAWYSMALE